MLCIGVTLRRNLCDSFANAASEHSVHRNKRNVSKHSTGTRGTERHPERNPIYICVPITASIRRTSNDVDLPALLDAVPVQPGDVERNGISAFRGLSARRRCNAISDPAKRVAAPIATVPGMFHVHLPSLEEQTRTPSRSRRTDHECY